MVPELAPTGKLTLIVVVPCPLKIVASPGTVQIAPATFVNPERVYVVVEGRHTEVNPEMTPVPVIGAI